MCELQEGAPAATRSSGSRLAAAVQARKEVGIPQGTWQRLAQEVGNLARILSFLGIQGLANTNDCPVLFSMT